MVPKGTVGRYTSERFLRGYFKNLFRNPSTPTYAENKMLGLGRSYSPRWRVLVRPCLVLASQKAAVAHVPSFVFFLLIRQICLCISDPHLATLCVSFLPCEWSMKCSSMKYHLGISRLSLARLLELLKWVLREVL